MAGRPTPTMVELAGEIYLGSLNMPSDPVHVDMWDSVHGGLNLRVDAAGVSPVSVPAVQAALSLLAGAGLLAASTVVERAAQWAEEHHGPDAAEGLRLHLRRHLPQGE